MRQIRKWFRVYTLDSEEERSWLGNTKAVSREQATNNIRFRFYSETSFEDLAQLGVRFVAEEVGIAIPKIVKVTKPKGVLIRTSPNCRQLAWLEIIRPVFSC